MSHSKLQALTFRDHRLQSRRCLATTIYINSYTWKLQKNESRWLRFYNYELLHLDTLLLLFLLPQSHLRTMKRPLPWSDGEDDSSSDESSTLDTDTESNDGSGKKKNTKISVVSSQPSKGKSSEVDSGKRKSKGINFEALSRHGYKGGLSILGVPAPKEADEKQDWSWSNGKESRGAKETEETYQERLRTRDAIIEGEQLTNVQTQKDKKNFSFSQKEKRKRDIGQASRGKSYVEEEKRLLRDNGVYSGFDS